MVESSRSVGLPAPACPHDALSSQGSRIRHAGESTLVVSRRVKAVAVDFTSRDTIQHIRM